MIQETKERLRKAKERYKKNLDKRLRDNSENIKPCDNVFLRIERKDEKEIRHRLAPIAQKPFPVTKIDEVAKTVTNSRF